jgi:hypothetical protein
VYRPGRDVDENVPLLWVVTEGLSPEIPRARQGCQPVRGRVSAHDPGLGYRLMNLFHVSSPSVVAG